MSRSVVAISMGGVGHVQALLPVISALRGRGLTVHALAPADFRERLEATGAEFIDLFARHPIDSVDATSRPIPSRNVTFAGAYAESLAESIAALAPALILYESFAVVAPVVARLLGLPYVNVLPNHSPVPARVLAVLRDDPRVAISEACWAAVERLRTVHGMCDATPFSYTTTFSPYLNLYGEPEEFLVPEDRAAFAPLAFFGVVAPPPATRTRVFASDGRRRRIYISFGTVIWWYFEADALAALSSLSECLAGEEVEVVISLGGHGLSPLVRGALERSNVRVVDHVDQWSILAEADAFVTHHGLNSTHEAIFRQVPMLSYPFFGDQPALAARCQEIGLALPLASGPRAAIDGAVVHAALARLTYERDRFALRLAQARQWELRTIAGREKIVDRIMTLAGVPDTPSRTTR